LKEESLPAAIVGYHLDEEGDWVADLECGHTQHVRHNPPWTNRPWVVTEEGRNSYLGYTLGCKDCVLNNTPAEPGRGRVKLIPIPRTMELSDYLAAIPPDREQRFTVVRELIRRLYPVAKESMRYRMPTYETESGWVALANQKQYISLYTCGEQHLEAFKQRHPDIKTGKGCINFRNRDEIPLEALELVIKSAMGRSAHD
jgi:uncharacterized protein YdhG (YjbR/CyaY superfamily)